MNKEHIGAPCPKCGEPVELIFELFETASYEIGHGSTTCQVSSGDFKAWANLIKSGGKKHLEKTAAFIKKALADYQQRASEIINTSETETESHGALLLKMRHQWLAETLVNYLSQHRFRDTQARLDLMGIIIDLQQKLKAAMENITALEIKLKKAENEVHVMFGTSGGAKCDICQDVYANYKNLTGERFHCGHCSAVLEYLCTGKIPDSWKGDQYKKALGKWHYSVDLIGITSPLDGARAEIDQLRALYFKATNAFNALRVENAELRAELDELKAGKSS